MEMMEKGQEDNWKRICGEVVDVNRVGMVYTKDIKMIKDIKWNKVNKNRTVMGVAKEIDKKSFVCFFVFFRYEI